MASDQLCEDKETFLQQHAATNTMIRPWGAGEERRLAPEVSPQGADESYFFDDRGVLVGAVFVFPSGARLRPYPVLRSTLAKLPPSMEFYLPGATVIGSDDMNAGTLYMTGDAKSTTQYVTSGKNSNLALVMASVSMDPYVNLLSPYRPEFLERLNRGKPTLEGPGSKDQEPFEALQAFAHGQAAQLGYCGERDYMRAAEAFRRALSEGLSDKVWMAEAHHRLGLALEGQGRLEAARKEMEQSLAIRPNAVEVLNNLGAIQAKLGERDKAIKTLEKAISLRPNYPLARFNLAEMYEPVNGKRAIAEYQTYLALVEGIPEEVDRVNLAKQRVQALSR